MNFLENVKADNSFLKPEIERQLDAIGSELFTGVIDAFKTDVELFKQYMERSGRGVGGSFVLRASQADLGSFQYGQLTDFAMKLAATTEIANGAILILDDVLDNSALRKGEPTAHERYNEHLNDIHKSQGLASHLATVALMNCEVYLAPTNSNEERAFASLRKSLTTTLVANMFETKVATNPVFQTRAHIDTVYRNKTSNYTLSGPVSAGLLISDSENRYIWMSDILDELGICFQILDDLEGLCASSEKSGKQLGDDVREKKYTYLHQAALTNADQTRKNHLRSIYAQDRVEESDIVQYISIIQDMKIDRILANEVYLRVTSAQKLYRFNKNGSDYNDFDHHIVSFGDFMKQRSKRYK